MSSQPNTRPTLFLDFDGVLHPGHAKVADYFCKVPLLGKAIRHADVSIVNSSSWRFHWTYEQIKAHFPESIKSKIDGMTGGAIIGRHAR